MRQRCHEARALTTRRVVGTVLGCLVGLGAACGATAGQVSSSTEQAPQQTAAVLAALPSTADESIATPHGRAATRVEAWPLGDGTSDQVFAPRAPGFPLDVSQATPWRLVLGLIERPAAVEAVHVCMDGDTALSIEVSTYPAATRVDRASWPQFLRNAEVAGHAAALVPGCHWLRLPTPTPARYVILALQPAADTPGGVRLYDVGVWTGAPSMPCDQSPCQSLTEGALPLPHPSESP